MIKWLIMTVKQWWYEQNNLCPHCGYYCTGKSVYCTLEERE